MKQLLETPKITLKIAIEIAVTLSIETTGVPQEVRRRTRHFGGSRNAYMNTAVTLRWHTTDTAVTQRCQNNGTAKTVRRHSGHTREQAEQSRFECGYVRKSLKNGSF